MLMTILQDDEITRITLQLVTSQFLNERISFRRFVALALSGNASCLFYLIQISKTVSVSSFRTIALAAPPVICASMYAKCHESNGSWLFCVPVRCTSTASLESSVIILWAPSTSSISSFATGLYNPTYHFS